VMVHDAARPLLQIAQLEALRLALQQHQAVILAQPLSDTLKRAEDQLVVATLPRDQLWAAQTPQCASVSVLRSALSSCLNRGLTVTDEASALEAANIPVYLVAGPRRNFKVTWPEDLALVQQVLENQR
jgi:2-C-methyl-D-erythritol 4-phosphate cytidylyltransferase